MNQKVVASFACKAENIPSNKKAANQETDLKNLNQAFHNVLLGKEIITLLENAYAEIEAILSQVKHWCFPGLASNVNDSQKTMLEVKICLQLRELDRLAETLTHKGQKLLNGTLSASVETNLHSFLLVGTSSSPENRINLNTSLNVPSISSKNLGLGELSISSQQNRLKGLMMLENAFAVITRLKQRSTILGAHLQEINLYLSVSIENHHAASTAPDSFEQAGEFIRVATDFIKKDKGEY